MANSAVVLLFKILATCTSLSVTLSLSPSLYRIFKARDTGIASVFPLVAVLGNSHVW